MKRFFSLLVIVIIIPVLLSCSSQDFDPELPSNSVILDAKESDTLWYLGFPGPRWIPDGDQVATLIENLPGYVEQQQPQILPDLDSYGGQFTGVTDDEERRFIYANFFCDPDTWEGWRTQLIEVADGGDCYFQALYDPQEEVFIWLRVNGES